MRLWMLLLLAAPLAGCLGGATVHTQEDPAPVWSDPLLAGEAYAFAQSAGRLSLQLAEPQRDDAWDVELYEPDDRRVGRFTLNATRSQVEVVGLGPGTAVLRVHEANGTLLVRDGSDPVASFHRLPVHQERHLLAQQDGIPVSLLRTHPLPHAVQGLELARTASSLRLLASGDNDELRLEVHDAGGPVLEATSSSMLILPVRDRLWEVPATFFPENLEQPALRVEMEAAHMDGVLVLEATSHSRSFAPNEGLLPASRPGSFVYGEVQDRPLRFQVHPGATRITLQGLEETSFSVWGPDDSHLAAAHLPAGAAASLRVSSPGDHVVVAHGGSLLLSADRTPADFELHPLETDRWEARALTGDGYIEGDVPVDVPGVVYAVTDVTMAYLGCSDDAFVRIVQGNETVGSRSSDAFHDPSPWLRSGPVTLEVQGLAPTGCLGIPLEILSWSRAP